MDLRGGRLTLSQTVLASGKRAAAPAADRDGPRRSNRAGENVQPGDERASTGKREDSGAQRGVLHEMKSGPTLNDTLRDKSGIRRARITKLAGRVLFLTYLACALIGCNQDRKTQEAAPQPTDPIPPLTRQSDGTETMRLPAHMPGLKLTTVRQVELSGVIETSGKISFDDRRVAKIISRVAGRIEAVWVFQWDNVRQGQPVVTLYSPDYMTGEAEYLQAEATAKLNLGPGSADQASLAASMVAAARRKLELLGLRPDEIEALRAPSPSTVLRAPIGGTIIDRQVIKGAQVNPGDILFTVAVLDPIWITADIYEDDMARIHPGQQLEAETPAFPGRIFKGVISRLSPGFDPNTHTAQLRCQVRNPGLALKPDMMARVRILTAPGAALVVSQDALIFEVDAYYAFVEVAPGRVTRRKVTIASWTSEGLTRVLSGLSAGDRVVKDESIQVNALWHEAHGESS
jgi:Cu(I)/Ag(I) efflux system membrane fusion protein